MDQQEWDEFTTLLEQAQSSVWEAMNLMDGIDGCAPGGEQLWAIAKWAIEGWLSAERHHYEKLGLVTQ